MAEGRNYFINGQCLVKVKGSTLSLYDGKGGGAELGLTDVKGCVTISPNFRFRKIMYDDYGSEVPAEIMWLLQDVSISMTLVHFDADVLEGCISQSNGGVLAGRVAGAGRPMGSGFEMYSNSGENHYITLYLSSPTGGLPWRFISCYLDGSPIEWPISAERSLVYLEWKAIPYAKFPSSNPSAEMLSSDIVIWDNKSLTDPV